MVSYPVQDEDGGDTILDSVEKMNCSPNLGIFLNEKQKTKCHSNPCSIAKRTRACRIANLLKSLLPSLSLCFR